MPTPPAVAAVAVAALALGLAGCDAVTSTAARLNPFPSFETRCARLPASRIDVRQQPIRPVLDESLTQDELTQRGGDDPETRRTQGLTRTDFRQEVAIELEGIADRGGGRSCARPRIVLDLAMSPMTVYLARELAQDACGRAAVYAHEMKHVAAFRAHLAATAAALEAEMPALFGQRLIVARDAAEGEAQVRDDVRAFLAEFTARNAAELAERQAEVDSPEEYARVGGACRAAAAAAPS